MNVVPSGKCIILVLILEILSVHGLPPKFLNIAVIGAGPSGLASAKNSLEQGHNVVVYEKGEALGGTWWYTDKTGKDEYGVDIHSAMYQGLRIDIPHQNMQLSVDHKFPNNTRSYPSYEDVWKYLNSYADRFDVKRHIKFHHLVDKVRLIENNKWNITVKNLPKNKTESLTFDVVFICINQYSSPNYPEFEGANEFKGKIIHSHDYRRAEDFRGADVLVVGGGPSGRDLILQLSKVANRITWSRRTYSETGEMRKKYGDNVTFKKNLKRFTSNGADFMDDTHQNFTAVIYGTGYKYRYPFLDDDSGIHVDNNKKYVQPLYKQIINIEHPSMAFIGIPYNPLLLALDLQARFALKFFSGAKELPSKSEMLKDMQDYANSQQKKGAQLNFILFNDYKEYFESVARAADVEKILDVYISMVMDAAKAIHADPLGFREYKYTIIDDETFIKEREV
ncbi:senecionine N-oxygenase-like [Contarinia nasturtii]|uniref:senecionine N-oxygenase-like n=1 Tax=Contarinia nasturtii TaxID=265458 RepID=UPI0012D3E6B7|nr:senecionine N-oxygenase-like [Contarinia nasturtii]XP_031630090.1 senecionine N-oxygenase-like [Contarinia nasturtii]XP_031630091.1 senecionine N-oxygenase-like [Contarinia nasturtii]